jgi:acetate kinase
MADFHSSDIEFSDQDSDTPRKAIASILEKSVEDRIESKKKVKKLRHDVANAPSTGLHRQYWHELFKQFAQHSLHIVGARISKADALFPKGVITDEAVTDTGYMTYTSSRTSLLLSCTQ